MGENQTVYQGQELLVMTGATQAALPASTPTIEATLTITPTHIQEPTPTSEPAIAFTPTLISEEEPAKEGGSSRMIIVVLIVAACVGAGMAVWLIREPE